MYKSFYGKYPFHPAFQDEIHAYRVYMMIKKKKTDMEKSNM